jgi:hypothetical protein
MLDGRIITDTAAPQPPRRRRLGTAIQRSART